MGIKGRSGKSKLKRELKFKKMVIMTKIKSKSYFIQQFDWRY